MCQEHEMMHPMMMHHKKGKKLLRLTASIVEAYLQTFNEPPSLEELQKIIKTVFATLKELKAQYKDEEKEEKE